MLSQRRSGGSSVKKLCVNLVAIAICLSLLLLLWSWATAPIIFEATTNVFNIESELQGGKVINSLKSKLLQYNNSIDESDFEFKIYDFSVTSIDGTTVPLSQFKGKVLLIVNVASNCKYTKQHYEEMAELYTKFRLSGFEIIAIPSNQFQQEPLNDRLLKKKLDTEFDVKYLVTQKSDVNGPDQLEIYSFLKKFFPTNIEWNFVKFLVNKKGIPVHRWGPDVSPKQITESVRETIFHTI